MLRRTSGNDSWYDRICDRFLFGVEFHKGRRVMRWSGCVLMLVCFVCVPGYRCLAEEPPGVPPVMSTDEYKAALLAELDALQEDILFRYSVIAGYMAAIELAEWPWEITEYQWQIMWQRTLIAEDLARCDQIRAILDAIENGV